MYIPKVFKNEDEKEILEFIKNNGFAILVTQGQNKILASHIPLYLSIDNSGNRILTGHVSRANQIWKDFENTTEVLAIFSGIHSYVSSSWYDHENVPTWNYIAVHVYGSITIIEGQDLLDSLKLLVDKYEHKSTCPVSVDNMTPEFIEREIKGIIGFKIMITDIQAAYKLSQNRDKKNYSNIINELIKTDDVNSKEVAKEMIKRKI